VGQGKRRVGMKIYYYVILVLSLLNIFYNIPDKNISAIFGWTSASLWLILVIIQSYIIDKKTP
jgi:hypothetical protein